MIEQGPDGWLELADGDGDGVDALVGAAHFGDTGGQTLEKVVLLGLHHPHDGLGHRRVVDGVVEPIGLARSTQVEVEGNVDLEGLRSGLLLFQRTVDPERPDTGDRNSVAHLAHRDLVGAGDIGDPW